MLVRITLLLNLVALVVVIAVILQWELPARDDLARLADQSLSTLKRWAQTVEPWIEAAVARLLDWAEVAWTWATEQIDRLQNL
jgi:hypothetical protein